MSKTPSAKPEIGIRCPICGGRTRVGKVVQNRGSTVRYRYCLADNCEGSVQTREREIAVSSISVTKFLTQSRMSGNSSSPVHGRPENG